MKKVLALLLAAVMVLSLAACGAAPATSAAPAEGSAAEAGSAAPAAGGSGALRLVNGKIEIDAQLKKLAQMYEEKTGVKVEIESMGGGIDIQGTLKGYYQAGNMPDIFVNGSEADFGNWAGLLEDMSGEAWVSDTDAAYTNADGVVGFPYTT